MVESSVAVYYDDQEYEEEVEEQPEEEVPIGLIVGVVVGALVVGVIIGVAVYKYRKSKQLADENNSEKGVDESREMEKKREKFEMTEENLFPHV